MELSNDLLSQFAKITNDNKKEEKEVTVYGTTVTDNGKQYVRLDGSDRLTPISTTTDMKPDERVTVMIKNHTATVTGNLSSPAARTDDVKEQGSKISEFEIIMAYKVTTEDLEAVNATIESLKAKVGNFTEMNAVLAQIETLQAKFAELDHVSAQDMEVINAEIEHIQAQIGEFKDISTEDLEAMNADIVNLKGYTADFTYVSADMLTALNAHIKNLDVIKLDVNEAELKFANIDFTNIGSAAIEEFFSKSGLIEDVVIGEGTITGNLVGVTIKGDLIEGGTVVADKLVIKGEDGLYYKLNFDGETVESEQTEYNSLNGSIITAKSITASKISVTDLVAFDATIGGFKITDSSIYSGVKSTADNTTRGIYLDKEGQLSVGDSSNFLRYFKDKEGQYHLELSASSIRLAATGEAIDETIEDMKDSVSNAMVDQDQQFYASTSPTELVGGEWQSSPPAWKDGIYIWSRTLVTYGNGSEQYVPDETGICITGNTGPAGGDGEQGPPGTDGKPGEKGEDGTGIESIITEYYMSTSKESPSGGEWIDIMPIWSSGMYLWIRSKITYTNPSSVEYTEPYCDSSWEAVNDVEVGGRNLIIRNGEHESQAYIMDEATGSELSADEISNAMEGYISVTPGEELTFHKEITEGYFRWHLYDESQVYISSENNLENLFTWIVPDGVNYIRVSYPNTGNVKVERGNMPTDWSPAPEDVDSSIGDAQNSADDAIDRVNSAESAIELLRESIVTMVKNEDGTTELVQDENGWTFNIDDFLTDVDNLSGRLDEADSTLTEAGELLTNIKSEVEALGKTSSYIRVSSDDSQPYIELGSSASDFQVRITNTEIQFKDGTAIPASISNKQLVIQSAVVKNELQFGNFIWKIRNSGNMGLIWQEPTFSEGYWIQTVTTAGINMRSGPFGTAPSVKVLYNGYFIKVDTTTLGMDYVYCLVELEGKKYTGYVQAIGEYSPIVWEWTDYPPPGWVMCSVVSTADLQHAPVPGGSYDSLSVIPEGTEVYADPDTLNGTFATVRTVYNNRDLIGYLVSNNLIIFSNQIYFIVGEGPNHPIEMKTQPNSSSDTVITLGNTANIYIEEATNDFEYIYCRRAQGSSIYHGYIHRDHIYPVSNPANWPTATVLNATDLRDKPSELCTSLITLDIGDVVYVRPAPTYNNEFSMIQITKDDYYYLGFTKTSYLVMQ